MKRTLHDNGLTLFFGTLFLLAFTGQAVAGFLEYNNQQVAEDGAIVSLSSYLVSSDFAVDTAGHARSDSPGAVHAGGARLWWYSRSLGFVMGTIFVGSWCAQSIAGRAAYNAEQLNQLEDPVTWVGYLSSADFWSRTLQNWQSEFLAIASMVVLSIFLRQRGSPESKPVGAAHSSTGLEG